MGIQYIDGIMLKRMIIGGANYLEQNKQIVDELNVFPVPDGDTGTNMSLTVLAAAKEVEKIDSDNVYEVAKAAASGSLRGARGNSGVILSQLFRGFSKGLENQDKIDTVTLANAFHRGVETAYKAVMKPKEGTILTVAREGAEKAMQLAVDLDDIEQLLVESLSHAHSTLDKTPDMLPVLKQAGVVDAGGRGLLYILEGALAVIHSNEDITVVQQQTAIQSQSSFNALAAINHEDITFTYCTEFIINRLKNDETEIEDLKEYLNGIGDSIVVVADEALIKVHVHTDHPGNAFEKGLTLGTLTNMKVDNMREQHTSKVIIEKKQSAPKEKKPLGFIAVAIGDGLSKIFKGLGVDYIIEGGQTMNPSTEDILNAVEQVHADKVIILPNNKNIILAAEQAIKLSTEKELIVMPTKTIPQGIAAMIGFEPGRTLEDNINNMKSTMEEVVTGQVTYAVRDTSINGKEIKQGNILGIGNGDIQVISDDLEKGTKDLIDQLMDGDSEIITIYYGQDLSEDQAQVIAEYIESQYPECEVEIHYGGQPLYYYIFSIE